MNILLAQNERLPLLSMARAAVAIQKDGLGYRVLKNRFAAIPKRLVSERTARRLLTQTEAK